MKRGLLIAAGILGLAFVVAIVAVMTPAGTRWVVGRTLGMANDRLDGTLRVGAVEGSVLGHLVLHDVEIVDPGGVRLVAARRVEVGYAVRALLRGDVLLEPLAIDGLFVRLVPASGGDGYTITNVLSGADTASAIPPSAAPRVEIRDLRVSDGTVVVHRPAMAINSTDPDAIPDSAIIVDSIHLTVPVALLSSPDVAAPMVVDVSAARAALRRPSVTLQELRGRVGMHGDTIRLSEVHVATRQSSAQVDGWILPDTGAMPRSMDLAVVVPRLSSTEFTWISDSIPAGLLLAGSARVRGSADQMGVELDASLADSSGTAVASVRASGDVALDADEVVRFRDVTIPAITADLTAARRSGLSVPVGGQLAINGRLNGSARAPRLDGDISYDDAQGRVTRLRGELGARYSGGPLSLVAHLALDSLHPGQASTRFPEAGLHGALGGRLDAEGPLDSLPFAVRLGGPAGEITASGTLGWRNDSLALDSVLLRLDSLDASQLSREVPVTRLTAQVQATDVLVVGTAGAGRLRIDLLPSMIDTMVIDTGHVAMLATRERLALDTFFVSGRGLRADGAGRYALADGETHDLRGALVIDSLGRLAGLLGDSTRDPEATYGAIHADVTVTGAPGAMVVEVSGRSDSSGLAGVALGALRADATWAQEPREVRATATVDSLAVAGQRFRQVAIDVSGADTAWRWAVGSTLVGQGVWNGGGLLRGDSAGYHTTIDSLRLQVAGASWTAEAGGVVAINDPRIATHLELRRSDAPARLTIDGRLPGDDSGHVELRVDSLPLLDLLRVAGDSTSEVDGQLTGRVVVSGRALAPRYAVNAELTGARIDTVTLPSVVVEATSANGESRGNARVVHEGRDLVRAEGASAIALPFPPVAPPDSLPVTIAIAIDSIPGTLVDRLLPSVQDLAGALTGHVDVSGTLGNPSMQGQLALRGGRVTLPTLGTRYHEMEGSFRFAGDSVVIDSLRIRDEDRGVLWARGSVGLADLANPRLDVGIRAANFIAIDDADYEDVMGSGEVRVTGPLRAMTLTGQLDLTRGVIRVADATRRDVIDLSDPLFASFVDTTELRETGTGAEFSDMILDSLRIQGLRVRLGDDVWVRSSEANIQLGGALTVEKRGADYPINGQVLAVRGTYLMALGPGLNREFSVTGGAIRFFNTDTLDAVLDIFARHVLRTVRGEMMTVFVRIGGTMNAPTVELSSDRSPALPQAEVISYLMFGAPSVQVFVGNRGREQRSFFEAGAEQFTALLAGRLEGAFSGAVDYFTITPVDPSQGYSETEILVGKQVRLFGSPSFVTVSPRICAGQWLSGLRRLGVSIETWMARQWLLDASIDPKTGCATPTTSGTAYQLGVDLFWVKR